MIDQQTVELVTGPDSLPTIVDYSLPSELFCFSLIVLFSLLICSYYDATIDRISDDGTTCTVTLEPFGNTEITKVD